ncbi:hypothetical protein G3567_10900 [Psychroflexus sp. YR1-1]|uniref:Uncharacterized protein n=1 Tax=Psychroflexus aurantiacus TaxID=2709310 RepID=A0A6B3R2S7_9FLAO|nr:hypothetical protein [Psychroflexus aurantiacus]NEV94652.1 hypothetical protein [Psychroflexus aurantiacus]
MQKIKTDTIQKEIQHINVDSLKTEILNTSESPIFIKTITEQGIDWGFIIPTIIALISTAIVIYDRVKKSKIGAKILSIAYSPKATFNGMGMDQKPFTIKGQQYFFKFSIQVIQKNFFFYDVEIKVKYPKDNNQYDAKIFWSDPITWNFDDGKTFDLRIPKNDFLWFNNTLPLNIVSFQYISFMVEVDKTEMIEEIEIIFIKPDGKKKKIKPIKISRIDPMKALFDKEIWIERK